MRRRAALLVTALALSALAVACGDDGGDADDQAVQDVVAAVEGDGALPDGPEVYSQRCASCHGGDGEGGIGPEIGDGAAEENLTLEEHADIVVNGRGSMPGWGNQLTVDEIAAVVVYEREQLGR